MVRGNDRQDMFATDGDRLMFLRLLREASIAHHVAIHGYVLMPNHVHLHATGAFAGGISKMVQHVGRKYVPAVNSQWGRCGSLWQSRYKSHEVDSDIYALNLLQYIEENPVRAGIVGDALDFPWSSHRCNALGRGDDLVTPHEAYLLLGNTAEDRQAAFRARFCGTIGLEQLERIRHSIRSGEPYGSEGLLDTIAATMGHRVLRRRTGPRPRLTVDQRKTIQALFDLMDKPNGGA